MVSAAREGARNEGNDEMIDFASYSHLLGEKVRVTLEDGVAYEGTYDGVRFDELRLGRDARSFRGDLVTEMPRGARIRLNRAFKSVVSVERV